MSFLAFFAFLDFFPFFGFLASKNTDLTQLNIDFTNIYIDFTNILHSFDKHLLSFDMHYFAILYLIQLKHVNSKLPHLHIIFLFQNLYFTLLHTSQKHVNRTFFTNFSRFTWRQCLGETRNRF